jgi:hypothetical protein
MTENTNSLAYHERRRVVILNDIGMEKTRHERAIQALQADLSKSNAAINMVLCNVDLPKVALARTIIDVRGLYEKAGEERGYAVEESIQRIANGGEKMRERFMGTKCYDRWHGQSVDMEYGYGPKHGSIIFAIEMRRDVRQRPKDQPLLTEEEQDAVIYYLRCLKQIQQAEQSGKVAA